jgi:hypothetical protein
MTKIDLARINRLQTALLFLPLLLLYVIIVVHFYSIHDVGDAGNYLIYAKRILSGIHFSNPADVKLMWGPGYPIFLIPFVALKLPLLSAKICNALFLYGAILFLFSTLKIVVKPGAALFAAYAAGLYIPFYPQLPVLFTEPMVYFLVSGMLYYSFRLIQKKSLSWPDLLICSLFTAYLALTKVFYGYVILTCLLVYAAFYLIRRKAQTLRMLLVFLLALVWCMPYLAATYHLTGKIFFWGASGGGQLFWMTTPYANEYGDWIAISEVRNNPELLARYGAVLNPIFSKSQPESDAMLKALAVKNIIQHPTKYFINWVANLGRLVFEYPYSYSPQTMNALFFILPNSILLTLVLLSLLPAFKRWKQIPYEIKTLTLFAGVALGGTSLLSAYVRQFTPTVPLIIIWIAFIFSEVLQIRLVDTGQQALISSLPHRDP